MRRRGEGRGKGGEEKRIETFDQRSGQEFFLLIFVLTFISKRDLMTLLEW